VTEASLDAAVQRIAAGQPMLIAGVEGRGATVAAAGALIDAAGLRRLHELGGDLAMLAICGDHAERLELTELPRPTRRRDGIVPVVPVDAVEVSAEAWSLGGRAQTIRIVSDPDCDAGAIVAPGHVHCGMVAGAEGAAPALAVELARTAGCPPAAVVSAILDRDGRQLDLEQARRDPRLRGVPVAPALELRTRAVSRELEADAVACELPTREGEFRALGHRSGAGGETVFALVHGNPAGDPTATVVHTHVACVLGDTFGSLLCDCGERLRRATREIVAAGSGVIVYVKPTIADPFSCPAGRTVDRSLALGVLRGAGLAAVADDRLAA
jgi:3,4-dihydroxy 2-butanone 4-phosphate synthase / GTP cyclohydrolase II